jgi:quercetin dioxygenase-like cupin family protein
MYTVREDEIERLHLPGRDVRLLIGADRLGAKNVTMGICEVPPQRAMDPHSHDNEEEVIYVLLGHGRVVVDGGSEAIGPGSAIYLPVGSEHHIINESDDVLKFVFCFSPKVIVGSYDRGRRGGEQA